MIICFVCTVAIVVASSVYHKGDQKEHRSRDCSVVDLSADKPEGEINKRHGFIKPVGQFHNRSLLLII